MAYFLTAVWMWTSRWTTLLSMALGLGLVLVINNAPPSEKYLGNLITWGSCGIFYAIILAHMVGIHDTKNHLGLLMMGFCGGLGFTAHCSWFVQATCALGFLLGFYSTISLFAIPCERQAAAAWLAYWEHKQEEKLFARSGILSWRTQKRIIPPDRWYWEPVATALLFLVLWISVILFVIWRPNDFCAL